jgi:gliding motility-associated-like protein
VTAVQPPVLTISPNATICSGTSTNIAVSGASFYVWSSMNGLTTNNGGANVVASPSGSSSYTVTGANASGCTGTVSISVDVVPTPVIAVSASPASICEGSSSELSATGAASYTWSPSSTLSNITGGAASATPLSTEIYTVTGSNGTLPYLCPATQTVEVVVTPTVNLVIPLVSPICFGETTAVKASGASSYTWSPSTGLSSPNQAVSNAKPAVTTIYTVTAGNGSMCTSQGTLELVVNPLPQVYAGADTTVNVDESVTLHGSGNVPVEFLATGSTPLNCNFCNAISVSPQEKTCYTLRGTSSAGCVAYDEVCVFVTKDWNVYIPNAFTPNGDADNDVFIPVGYGLSQIKLLIFDRWGTQIFAGDENNPGWDGKLKGKLCEQGVYVYQVEIKTMAGNTFKKVGHVTLLGTVTR